MRYFVLSLFPKVYYTTPSPEIYEWRLSQCLWEYVIITVPIWDDIGLNPPQMFDNDVMLMKLEVKHTSTVGA